MKKQYIDIKKNWRKIRPYAVSDEATKIWKRDLKKHHTAFRVYGPKLSNESLDEKWFNRILKFEWYFKNNKPSDYDSCDWRGGLGCGRRGRKPSFWDYVVHGKCYWIVNLNLFLAENAFPKEPWRIIASDEHSCVWNGAGLIFDMNYSALVPDVAEHPFYDELDGNVIVLQVGEEFEINILDMDVEVLDMYDEGAIPFAEMHDYFFNCADQIK